MSEDRRRRAPRAAVHEWPARYRVEDDPWSTWQECSVLDISPLGIGLELHGSVDRRLVGQRFAVEVYLAQGQSLTVGLHGVVRNLGPGPWGGTRAGLKFTGLSSSERCVLRLMERLTQGELVGQSAG